MAVTVNGNPGGSPAPFVEVVVDSVMAGSAAFTVWRTAAGRTFQVRDLAQVPTAAGGGTARDFEAPFGVESSYSAEFYDAAGVSLGFTPAATVTLPSLPPNMVWWHDPLDPAASVLATALAGFGRAISRPTDSAGGQVPGRSVSLLFPGTRQGVKGVTLDCITRTRAAGLRFDQMLGAYDSGSLSVVCIRANPETWLPPTLFAFVGSPTLQPVGETGETVTWGITGDECPPPVASVVTPLLEYTDFDAFYASYDAFDAAYATYLDAERDYSVRVHP